MKTLILEQFGLTVELIDDDALRVTPASRITPEAGDYIRSHAEQLRERILGVDTFRPVGDISAAIVTSLVINRASQVNDCMSCRHWKGAQSVPASRYTALSAARVDVKPRSNTVGMCARYNKPWRVSNIASDPDYQRWQYIGHCGREAA